MDTVVLVVSEFWVDVAVVVTVMVVSVVAVAVDVAV